MTKEEKLVMKESIIAQVPMKQMETMKEIAKTADCSPPTIRHLLLAWKYLLMADGRSFD